MRESLTRRMKRGLVDIVGASEYIPLNPGNNPKTIMIEDKASGTGERSWDYVGTPPAFAPQAFRHFMRHLLLLDSIHLDNGLHRMGRPIESANDPCGRFWHALRNSASGSKQNAMSAVADGFYLSQGA